MQMFNVRFDNQIFILQKFGGISRYFIELFKVFDKKNEVKWSVMGLFSRNFYLGKDFKKLGKIQVDHWSSKKSHQRISILNKLSYLFPFKKQTSKVDLYHFTYYDAFYFNRFKNGIPRVVTVYDMIEEIFNGDPGTIYSKKHVVSNADLVLAISESTAGDILKYYNISSDKIIVTYLASSLQPIQNGSLNQMILPRKYVLFVGLREGYKNFENFLEAMRPLLNSDPDLFVLCAGGPAFNKKELDMIRDFNSSEQVIWKPIDGDDHLAWYYQNALFFVFPSKYEGFGIPILEAMNCDCPVALSETSSLKEIASYAGYYFDPNSIESIRNSCLQLINSETTRKELIEKGRTRRNDFSWEKTATETLKAYKLLLSVK